MADSKNLSFNAARVSAFTSFGFFAAVSVLMMVVDHKLQVMEPLRTGFSDISNVTYAVLTSPIRGVQSAAEYFHSKASLVAENKTLKEKIQTAELERHLLSRLAEENQVLKDMLVQKSAFPIKMEMFDVRRMISDGFTQRYIINGGSNDGLAPGMPVLTEAGLAGQLIHVANNSSQVQLIQDKNQKIPVFFEGSKIVGIVEGAGDGKSLRSRGLPYSDLIQPGDRVVTSGLDGVFPKGIPVGVVSKVEPIEAGAFLEVTIDTPKSVSTGEKVLVVLVDTETVIPSIKDHQPSNGRRSARLEK